MKIRTKLALEVIFLISLVSTVGFIALYNTKIVQESFLILSLDTLPTLDSLKDMRLATTQIHSGTVEILLILQETQFATGEKLRDLEEKLETKTYEMENAKELFNHAFSKYSQQTQGNLFASDDKRSSIAQNWNELIILSNKMIQEKTKVNNGDTILSLNDKFENKVESLHRDIDNSISIIGSTIDTKQDLVESIVNNTTLTIFITLNLFIIGALGIRFFILKSISRPLSTLRRTTAEIAQGNFVKSQIKGNDEISDLAKDIDKMSDKLKELNQTLVKTERLSSIGNLASRLAHDLRNPLSVIKNSMGLLNLKLDHIMDEKTSLQMARVGRAVARMSHQIDDVLDYVNVSELHLESSSIATIIESATLGTNVPAHVKVNLPKNNVTMICDPFKLEIVFTNLINNAIQAIDGDGEINIRLKDLDSEIQIEFEDSGPGIPESIIGRIFEPLFTTKQIGTGLGLASCQSIIEKHGGTISVTNHPTTFSLRIPKNPNLAKIDEENTFKKNTSNEQNSLKSLSKRLTHSQK